MIAKLTTYKIITSLLKKCIINNKNTLKITTPLSPYTQQDSMTMQFFYKPCYFLKLTNLEAKKPNKHNPKTWQLQMQISNVIWK